MFGKKSNITLFENEEIIDSFKLRESALVTGRAFGNTGKFTITNQRIICELSQFNIWHSMLHNAIISFNWGNNIPTEGTRFTILYSDINDFGNPEFYTVELRVHDRKKIKKILETYPYYEKPQVIPTTNQSNTAEKTPPQESQEDPLKILKTRYAKGEITTEQYNEMKNNLS